MVDVQNFYVTTEPDLYDGVVDGLALFSGVFAGVAVRIITTSYAPAKDSITKVILRETGSIALMTAISNTVTSGVKIIGKKLKPYIMER